MWQITAQNRILNGNQLTQEAITLVSWIKFKLLLNLLNQHTENWWMKIIATGVTCIINNFNGFYWLTPIKNLLCWNLLQKFDDNIEN